MTDWIKHHYRSVFRTQNRILLFALASLAALSVIGVFFRPSFTSVSQYTDYFHGFYGGLDGIADEWAHLSVADIASLNETAFSAEFNSSKAIDYNYTSPEYDTDEGLLPNASSPNPKYSAAIVWLTRRAKLAEMTVSIESVARNVPMSQPYSIVLMHSGDLNSDSIQREFRNSFLAHVELVSQIEPEVGRKMKIMETMMKFVLIDMEVPARIAEKGKAGLQPVFFSHRWPGYHSMCRFFAVLIFWHPEIRKYDYYMRMDTDSHILSPMIEDPFHRAVRHGVRYAYRHSSGDVAVAVKGMASFLENYASRHTNLNLTIKLRDDHYLPADDARNLPSWYNNWEIAHLPSFRRPQVADFLMDLLHNHEEGFYKHRWGDAPLRRATTTMFFESTSVVQYCDFVYRHQYVLDKVAFPTDEQSFPNC